MKILMLTCMFMPEVYGGAEQQCFRQSKALTKRGHNVTILSSRTRLSTKARETIDDVTIRRQWTIKQPDLLGRWVIFSFIWIIQSMLFAYRHRGEYDVIHCHQGKFGLYIGSIISRIMGIPQLVKIGNSDEALDINALKKKSLFGPFFLKRALKNTPTFIAISQKIVDDLKAFSIAEKQIVKITNGVMPITPTYHPPSDQEIHFFWHGRFEPIKNLTLMLEGFALARKIDSSITLTLIGDGSQEETLRTLTQSLQITECVNFVAPPENIITLISAYDIFINTSEAEGMSNSMLEALSLGKAIISTPVSGTKEIIDEGKNGIIMSAHTEKDVASAIRDITMLIKEDPKKVYDHSIHKAENEFAMDNIAKACEELYTRLLSSH